MYSEFQGKNSSIQTTFEDSLWCPCPMAKVVVIGLHLKLRKLLQGSCYQEEELSFDCWGYNWLAHRNMGWNADLQLVLMACRCKTLLQSYCMMQQSREAEAGAINLERTQAAQVTLSGATVIGEHAEIWKGLSAYYLWQPWAIFKHSCRVTVWGKRKMILVKWITHKLIVFDGSKSYWYKWELDLDMILMVGSDKCWEAILYTIVLCLP